MHASIEYDPRSHIRLTRIMSAIGACDEQCKRASEMPHTTDLEHAERAERLMLAFARRAAWWRVLSHTLVDTGAAHLVFIRAVGLAIGYDEGYVRFWRETAADWRARAEGRPTSDVAGAMSNRHELEGAV